MQLEVSPVSPVPPRAETCGSPCSVEHLFSGAGKKRPEGDPFSLKERYPNSAAPTSLLGFLPGGGRGKSRAPGCPPAPPGPGDASTSPSPDFPASSPSPVRFLAHCRSPVGRRGFIPGVKPSAMLWSCRCVLKAANRRESLGNAAGVRREAASRAGVWGSPSHWPGPRVGGELTPLTPPSPVIPHPSPALRTPAGPRELQHPPAVPKAQ